MTEAYSQTLTNMNEAKMNDRVKMTEMKNVSYIGHGAREPTRVGANKTKEEMIVQREKFGV